jgi:hypothetical protein
MAEPIWIKDVWLTARQWDLIRDALVQRGTKQAETVRERIWQQLILTPGYQRHMRQTNGSDGG